MTTEQTKAFVLAGNAVFTVSNGKPAPDARDYTFKVSKSKPEAGRQPAYFVALLTGSDNENDYQYLGLLDPTTGRVRLTAKSHFLPTSAPVVAVGWVLPRVWTGQSLGTARVQHVGRCGKCNRALTVPESIDSGLGPECSGLGYTKPRNERKPRTKKAPKSTFEQLRAQAQAAAVEHDGGLGLPAGVGVRTVCTNTLPALDVLGYPVGAPAVLTAEDWGLPARTEALPDTLDLGGLYADNLAGFYAAAAAEDSVDRAERALGVQ